MIKTVDFALETPGPFSPSYLRRECWWRTRSGWAPRRRAATTGATYATHARRSRSLPSRFSPPRFVPGSGRFARRMTRSPTATSTPTTSPWGGSAAAATASTTLSFRGPLLHALVLRRLVSLYARICKILLALFGIPPCSNCLKGVGCHSFVGATWQCSCCDRYS